MSWHTCWRQIIRRDSGTSLRYRCLVMGPRKTGCEKMALYWKKTSRSRFLALCSNYVTIIDRKPLPVRPSTIPNLDVVPSHILSSNTDVKLTTVIDTPPCAPCTRPAPPPCSRPAPSTPNRRPSCGGWPTPGRQRSSPWPRNQTPAAGASLWYTSHKPPGC